MTKTFSRFCTKSMENETANVHRAMVDGVLNKLNITAKEKDDCENKETLTSSETVIKQEVTRSDRTCSVLNDDTQGRENENGRNKEATKDDNKEKGEKSDEKSDGEESKKEDCEDDSSQNSQDKQVTDSDTPTSPVRDELTEGPAEKEPLVLESNLSKALQAKWDAMFDRLLEFKKNHGHCLVPNRYAEDRSLGAWVSTQRRQYKVLQSGSSRSTPMSVERARRLNEIGMVWSTKDPRHTPWEKRYEQLCDFHKKFGHSLVPIGYKKNVSLSNWVSTQRQEFKSFNSGKPSRITAERIKLLNDIEFVWDAQKGHRKQGVKRTYHQSKAKHSNSDKKSSNSSSSEDSDEDSREGEVGEGDEARKDDLTAIQNSSGECPSDGTTTTNSGNNAHDKQPPKKKPRFLSENIPCAKSPTLDEKIQRPAPHGLSAAGLAGAFGSLGLGQHQPYDIASLQNLLLKSSPELSGLLSTRTATAPSLDPALLALTQQSSLLGHKSPSAAAAAVSMLGSGHHLGGLSSLLGARPNHLSSLLCSTTNQPVMPLRTSSLIDPFSQATAAALARSRLLDTAAAAGFSQGTATSAFALGGSSHRLLHHRIMSMGASGLLKGRQEINEATTTTAATSSSKDKAGQSPSGGGREDSSSSSSSSTGTGKQDDTSLKKPIAFSNKKDLVEQEKGTDDKLVKRGTAQSSASAG